MNCLVRIIETYRRSEQRITLEVTLLNSGSCLGIERQNVISWKSPTGTVRETIRVTWLRAPRDRQRKTPRPMGIKGRGYVSGDRIRADEAAPRQAA